MCVMGGQLGLGEGGRGASGLGGDPTGNIHLKKIAVQCKF